MTRRYAFILAVAILTTSHVSAQSDWEWLNPLPQGNDLLSVWFVNPSVGWTVGTGGMILKTTDGGATWSIQRSNTTSALRGVRFLNEQTGFACGMNATIVKTTDGGSTWLNVEHPFVNIGLVDICFVNDSVGWVGGGWYVLRTRDAGATWQLYTDSWPWHSITDLYFFSETSGLWASRVNKKTTDGGVTWNYAPSAGLPYAYRYTNYSFTDAQHGWTIGDNGAVGKTTDGGASWTATTTVPSGMRIAFTDTSNGWAVGFKGLYKTTDSGISWTEIISGDFADLFFTGSTGCIVGTTGKIYISGDGGATWTPAVTYLAQLTGTTQVRTYDRSYALAAGDSGKIFRTLDGGTSWERCESPVFVNEISYVTIPTFDRAFALCDKYILRSLDTGKTWTVSFTNTFYHFNDIHFLDERTGWAVSSQSEFYTTTNGGDSWTKNPYYLSYATKLWMLDELTLVMMSFDGSVRRTTDGGHTWSAMTTPGSAYLYSMAFADQNRGWIAGNYERIWATTDGGMNWTVRQYLPSSQVDNQDICVLDSVNLVVVGSESGSMYTPVWIQVTNDGGTSWDSLGHPSGMPLVSVSFADRDHGFVAGEDGQLLRYRGWTGVPDPPTNPSAEPLTGSSLRVTWTDASSNETGFRVFRSDRVNGRFRSIGEFPAGTSTFDDEGLESMTRYWYRIAAVNASGRSPLTREVSAQTLLAPPAPPALVSPANELTFVYPDVLFQWCRARLADSYHFQASLDSIFSTMLFDSSGVIDSTFIGVQMPFDTTVYWRVRGVNAAGSGDWSQRWSFRTRYGLPSYVEVSDMIYPSAIYPCIRWSRGTYADTYELMVKTTFPSDSLIMHNSLITDTSYVVGPLEFDRAYAVTVRSIYRGEAGPWSYDWFQTISSLPLQVALQGPPHYANSVSDTLELRWHASSPYVTHYAVEVDSTSAFVTPFRDTLITELFYVLRNLVSGRQYWWRVQAYNVGGWGMFSEMRMFIVTPTSVQEQSVPQEFALLPNYPNPFNPSTTIRVSLPVGSHVRLQVFNILGQAVDDLAGGEFEAGYLVREWTPRGATGVYVCRLEAVPVNNPFMKIVRTRRIVFLR